MVKMMDLEGHKYGSWTVLRREGITKAGFAIWICECKCGTLKPISSVNITHKIAKQHCGCEQDWTGRKFGKLTVLKKISGLGNHAAKILCKCDCGNEKIVWGGNLYQGSVQSCGCIKSRTEDQRCITIAYNVYRRHATERDIEFNLGKEDFGTLILKECFYCGKKDSNTTRRKTKFQGELSLQHNGVDRIDSSKSYDIANCVPCCRKCNHMKWDLSLDDWKNHMKLVLGNLELKQAATA